MSEDPLAGAPLFAALESEAAAALRASMSQMASTAGAVSSEGEPGDRVYVVTDGKIEAGATSNDGRETLLGVLGPGPCSEKLSLRAHGPPRPPRSPTPAWSARTRRPHPVARWPPRGRPVPAAGPGPAPAPHEAMADLVFSDVRSGRQGAARPGLALRPAPARRVDPRDPRPHQKRTAQVLVGASRETALADFQTRGWISLEPRNVSIVDVDRLTRHAHSRRTSALAEVGGDRRTLGYQLPGHRAGSTSA